MRAAGYSGMAACTIGWFNLSWMRILVAMLGAKLLLNSFSPDTQLNECRKQHSFLSLYIESVSKEPPRNLCTLTLSLESDETQSHAYSEADR